MIPADYGIVFAMAGSVALVACALAWALWGEQ